MTYKLNKVQFDSVVKLAGPERYKHFIARIADWRQVWTLKQPDGFVTLGDDEGHVCVPLWPHADYAKALAFGDWATCVPVDVDLDSFKEKWLPGLLRDKYSVAVFPTPDQKGVVVSPERLAADLREELAEIEQSEVEHTLARYIADAPTEKGNVRPRKKMNQQSDNARLFEAAYRLAEEVRDGCWRHIAELKTTPVPECEAIVEELRRRCPGLTTTEYKVAIAKGLFESRQQNVESGKQND